MNTPQTCSDVDRKKTLHFIYLLNLFVHTPLTSYYHVIDWWNEEFSCPVAAMYLPSKVIIHKSCGEKYSHLGWHRVVISKSWKFIKQNHRFKTSFLPVLLIFKTVIRCEKNCPSLRPKTSLNLKFSFIEKGHCTTCIQWVCYRVPIYLHRRRPTALF